LAAPLKPAIRIQHSTCTRALVSSLLWLPIAGIAVPSLFFLFSSLMTLLGLDWVLLSHFHDCSLAWARRRRQLQKWRLLCLSHPTLYQQLWQASTAACAPFACICSQQESSEQHMPKVVTSWQVSRHCLRSAVQRFRQQLRASLEYSLLSRLVLK